MDEIRQRCLSRLPDLPVWVETRDLLLRDDSRLLEHPARQGFVVWKAGGLGSVVGAPEPGGLLRAAGEVTELLAFADNIEHVKAFLPAFSAEACRVLSAPDHPPPAPGKRCRELDSAELAAQHHLPAELMEELCRVADDGVLVVAAFDGKLPVAFAYVASETESLWDLSIDTIESHRRQGYASAAVLYLMRRMHARGKSAVWGALDSNHASAGLARHLGFVQNDRLWLLTPDNEYRS